MSGEAFIENEVAEQLSRNEKLIQTILQHGGELGEERPIDFFFYTDTEPVAQALAGQLRTAGFDEVAVAPEAFDGKWGVQAVRRASVNEITEERFVRTIVTIAAQHLAEFDGWGTPI